MVLKSPVPRTSSARIIVPPATRCSSSGEGAAISSMPTQTSGAPLGSFGTYNLARSRIPSSGVNVRFSTRYASCSSTSPVSTATSGKPASGRMPVSSRTFASISSCGVAACHSLRAVARRSSSSTMTSNTVRAPGILMTCPAGVHCASSTVSTVASCSTMGSSFSSSQRRIQRAAAWRNGGVNPCSSSASTRLARSGNPSFV